MSYRSIIFLMSLIMVLVAGNFHVAQTASAAADGEQPKYALLVGITNYKSPTLNKIDGCENNVPLLAQTLIDLYGFKKQDVRTLIDGQAGKKAIVDEFRQHLTGNARKAKEQGKQAVIVYYFCGHGSQYPDQKVDADENDGLDETFVAWDSRTDSVPDILDDEIDDLKAELRPFTHNTTLILESCHSGTGSRGDVGDNEFISEEADADKKKYPPYVRKFPPTSVGDANTYVEIAASASIYTAKSESREYCKCDKPYSLMTKALVEALNRATYGTTYRGLMREVSYAVSERSQQDPQVEGSVHDPLFRGAARRAKPYIDILSLLPNGQIMIRAGRIHGLKEGSQVAIYDRGSETNLGDAGWLTNGIVTEIKGLASAVVQLPTFKDNPNAAKVEIASHVVLASPVFGGGPVLLALDTATPTRDQAGLASDVEKELNGYRLLENGMVSIVEPKRLNPASSRGARGILRLKRAKFLDAFPSRIKEYARVPRPTKCTLDGDKVIPETLPAITPETEIYYLDDGGPGGMPLFGKVFLPVSTAAADIAATVRNYALRTNLLSLSNEASTLQKGVEVTPKMLVNIATVETCRDGEIKVGPRTIPQPGDFRVVEDGRIPFGAAFFFQIENISGAVRRKKDEFASGEPVFITCIVLRNNGEIKVAYQSGPMYPLGDGVKLKERVGGSFASKPGGPEQLIVIVSRKFVDFRFYESTDTTKSAQPILEQILKQSGIKTRQSGTVIPDEPDGWGVLRVDLNIGG